MTTGDCLEILDNLRWNKTRCDGNAKTRLTNMHYMNHQI